MDCDSTTFQAIRIVDVFVLGPAMVQVGRRIGGNIGGFIVLAGVATIIFNGLTFLNIERRNTL